MRALTSSFVQPCLLGLLLLGVAGVANGTIIDYDATIDGHYTVLNVQRGSNPNPPTVVTLVDGALIGSNVPPVAGHLEVHDDSIVHIEPGARIIWELYALDDSVVYMSGGAAGDTYVWDNGTLNMSSGYAGMYLSAEDSSTVNFSGGQVGHGISGVGSSTLNISDGAFGFLNAWGTSTVNLSGWSDSNGWGQMGLGASGSATVNVFGRDLLLTEDPEHEDIFALTGTWADRSPVDIRVSWSEDAQIILHQVPEPSTAALGLTAGLALLAYALRKTGRKTRKTSKTGSSSHFTL